MKKLLLYLRRKIFADVIAKIDSVEEQLRNTLNGQETQILLKNQYKALSEKDLEKYSFDEVAFRKYSQNKEDGILLFIFSVIGTTNKTILEICAGDGIECNAANLLINHGWNALLFDGNAGRQNAGKSFYSRNPDTFAFPPRFINAWITKENINQLITDNGIEGEIDLLSLDMDGVDYWIWDAIASVCPRVVIAEIQCIWGNERAVTIPYKDDFATQYIDGFGVYSGASLPAFVKLAKKKGYRFVGLENYGFNAFFIREDVAPNIIKEADPAIIENIPFVKWAKTSLLPKVSNLEWQTV